jgi:alkanesulfonate monooxygenase SsuD/methylene tetrahydromethanopterin reductase-like flavin-dependent oxidoreductase (luciferase family)/iron-sulfur cluster repair protein YtfE (RIC family)
MEKLMSDYGHDLLFGAFIQPSAEQAQRVVALAQLTEEVGLDLASFQDHPYQPSFLDTWTLLSVVAARTTRLRVLPNVANLPLRPPAVLAHSAASLDILTNGRVELGLGAGAFWDAIAGQGGPRRSAGESISALEEAIQVMRALWTPGRGVRFNGKYYQLQGAKPGPFPVHDIGIWLGAYKPRILRLTGRRADGWLPSSSYLPAEELAEASKIIDEAAVEAGRDPGAVRRLYNILGEFTPEQLAELTLAHGMSGYILATDSPDAIQRFAAEVAPAVREMVAAERARGADRAITPILGTGAPAPTDNPAPPPRERVTANASNGPRPAEPTPDDGVRLSSVQVWDETSRPAGPASDPAYRYTPQGQASSQHLVEIHDHLREELAQLRGLIEQVAAGSVDPGIARSHIATMTLRQNKWTVGAYCASYCRVLTTHHTIEDRSMFPHLRQADKRLAPVIDRLEAEHHAIHEVIERVDQALVTFLTAPDGMATLRAAVDVLTDTLLSHLSYEERELVEPLARLGLHS